MAENEVWHNLRITILGVLCRKTRIYGCFYSTVSRETFNVIDNKTIIERIANEAVMGFTPNINTISKARTIVVQTVVTQISGYERDGSFTTAKKDGWEMYDAGISAQTFCLIAHEYGLGTVIMGIFDENKMRETFSIPENETVTAIIGVGYPTEERPVPKHRELEEILRFI